LSQKFRFAAVGFIEDKPFEDDSVFCCAIVLFQGDLPFRTINDVIGNARRVATFTVLVPRLRQKKVLIDKCMKIALGVGEVNGNDAVFLFADGSTILPLNAWSFRTFFNETCLVDDSDGMFSGMIFSNDFLDFVSHSLVVPFLLGKEPLNGSDGFSGLESDGFTIFPWQVGEESGGINSEIIPGILVGHTGFESSEQSRQIGSNIGDFRQIHFGVLRVVKLHIGRILQHFYRSDQGQFIAL
jgi:hypothetical protein